MGYTTVVAAPEGASLGERYATIATAAALGERVRDQGGHALVVIDDLACMVRALHDCLPMRPVRHLGSRRAFSGLPACRCSTEG